MKTIILEIVRKIKRVLKKQHLLPVYPIDILMEIKNNPLEDSGLCYSIASTSRKFKVCNAKQYIKKFDKDIAIDNFGGKDRLYWWEIGIWDTGRLDFLNFLIKENKTNKIDLRKALLKIKI